MTTHDTLTPRDELAMHAMQGLLVNLGRNAYESNNLDAVAEDAYKMADAMLTQRQEATTEEREPNLNRFFILNDFDRPAPETIVAKRSDGYYYIHPKLKYDENHWAMQAGSQLTPIENFGISVEIIANKLFGELTHASCATYRDGKPRLWQGPHLFSFHL